MRILMLILMLAIVPTQGRVLSRTTGKGKATTTFAYDALGRRIKRTLPDGKFQTWTYDLNGNAVTQTDFKGKTTSYAYDKHNRPTGKTPDPSFGAAAVTYTYTPAGQRGTMVDPSGTTTYTYDNLDRLKTRATPFGTLSYTYDDQGNLLTTSSSNTDGIGIAYEHDDQSRLKKVTDTKLSTTSKAIDYGYDAVGNLTSVAYPNSVTHAYTFNNLNRLTDLSVTGPPGTLASYAYTLGATGNRTMVAEAGGRRVQYSYDNLYRLTIESVINDPAGVNGTVGYTHDLVGNRTRRESTVTGVPAAVHAYDNRDRIDPGTAYSYDDNGNTTLSPGGNADTYDFEDRLVSRTAPGKSITIVYDGDGNRVQKTVNGVVTKYLVDTNNLTGYAQVVEELNSSNAVQRRYTYGHDLISQTRKAVGVWIDSFYLYDGHGSVRKLTNSAGVVTDTYTYDAFGILVSSTGLTPNNYLYAGEQFDHDLGMYYNRGRYYEEGLGRFWTQDTFEGNSEDPRSLHKYLYAHANPVMYVDPTGNMSVMEVITVGSVSLNFTFAAYNISQGNYAHAAFDLLGAGFGVFGLFGKFLPPMFAMAGSGVSIGAITTQEALQLARGLSIVIAGTDLLSAMMAAHGELHHLMTDKNNISTAPNGTGPYTPKFKELLKGTGIDFQDAENIVEIIGHSGPHAGANKYTYEVLVNAVKGIPRNTQAYTEAVQKALARLAKEAQTKGTELNKLLVD